MKIVIDFALQFATFFAAKKNIGKNLDTHFYIMTYISKNIFFGFSEVRIVVIWMRTWMNDSIHVQVQIIKVRNLKFNGDKTK